MKEKSLALFLALAAVWYLIFLIVPYNTLANSLGIVSLGNGYSWPLSFFLMDGLAIALTILFVAVVVRKLKKKQFQWWLLSIIILYPLLTVWATLQDLILSPIAR